jgi:aspartate aminotransferase-like enzyme
MAKDDMIKYMLQSQQQFFTIDISSIVEMWKHKDEYRHTKKLRFAK